MNKILLTVVAALSLSTTFFGADLSSRDVQRITKEVRHELISLPYYNVFDNLVFQVAPDGTVTLVGSVTRPVLKTQAEKAIKDIEGVPSVRNNIEVLPLSATDDNIRLGIFQAIYGQPALNRYAIRAVPSIHIIVKNGDVTLEGIVSTEGDKNNAAIQANGIGGVRSVKNNLQIEASKDE